MFLSPKKEVNHFETTVLDYEKQPFEEGKIVFYGDSAFTRWSPKYDNIPLESCIPGTLNHGIGGSTSEDLLYYYQRMVKAYKPRALVLQAFCNDRDLQYTPSEIVYLQARIIAYMKADFPDAKIYVCDARPLACDMEKTGAVGMMLRNHRNTFNELLYAYCAEEEGVTLIRHTDSPCLYSSPESVGSYDTIRADIFIEDKVHYNPEGYVLYTEFFKEALKDIL